MNGHRRWQKFTLGLVYLGVGGFLAWKGLVAGADPTGLGVMLGGLATGVGVVVYGNVQEHRAYSKGEAGATKT